MKRAEILKTMKALCVGRAGVDRWLREARKKKPQLEDLPRPGRPPKFSSTDKKKVKRAFTERRNPGNVASALSARGSLDISRSTVRRIWMSGRKPILYRPVVQSRVLSVKNQKERLAFAQSHEPSRNRPWAFTDGKWCTLYKSGLSGVRYVWTKTGDNVPRSKGAVIGRFFFYAVVGHDLKSPLIFTAPSPKKGSKKATGGRNFVSSDFVQVMRDLKPHLDRWRPSGRYWLIRDRAKQHVSAEALAGLAPLNIPILEAYPAQSWDINCIEHVWAQLMAKLKQYRPRTARGFREAIQAAWDAIDQATINRMVEDVPRRLKKIIEKEGKWISAYKEAGFL